MIGRRFGALAAAAALAGAALVAITASPVAATGPCSATPTRTLTGAQPAFTSTLAANERVKADGATWTGTTNYPVYFGAGSDACWDGGSITGTFPVTTTWNSYHGKTAFGFAGPNFTLDHPRIFNQGDGINVGDGASNFTIRSAYLAYIHDDCIQNDDLFSGTVTDSYLDGCYVAFSARRSDGTSFDGHLNTWTISNSLVRLQAMPTVYKGTAAGHGGFFKWDDSALLSPKLNISNTIFRADQDTNHQDLNLPAGYNVTCSNNTMVWLGDGPFPGSLPSCFTITTDRSVWDAAARAWDVAHPGVITGPEVSVGDGSVIEGESGTRFIRFPISLSSAPGSGKVVTVYWSTTPGTAATSDYKTTKGKLLFKGSQVLKTVSVKSTPDTKTESDERMALVVAGVDGGENHRERGVGTIVNDDPGSGIRLAVADQLVVEGDSGTRNLLVPITLTKPATGEVLINYTTVAGTATAGADFTAKSGTVKIKAKGRFVNLSIPIKADLGSEGTESFQVVVNSATNATVIDNTGVVSIRDDD